MVVNGLFLSKGDQWSGPTTFKVDAQKAENYQITYKPVKMTHDGIKTSTKKLILKLTLYSGAATPFYLRKKKEKDKG
jgi:hypothetical protein